MQHGRRASLPLQSSRTVPTLQDRESSGSEKGDDDESSVDGASDEEDADTPDASDVRAASKRKDVRGLFRQTVQAKVQPAASLRHKRRASVDVACLHHARDEGADPEATASEEKKEFEGTAAWMARLQSNEEVISRKKECCRAQVSMLEVALPAVAALPASKKIRLLSDMEQEVDGIMQVMARQAYMGAKSDFNQVQAVKTELAEMEERTASCHKMYLREMSDARDKKRESAKFLVNDVNEVGVHFYEPLQCLSEEVRSLTMNIIDERLKAIFDFNPAMQDKANAVEVARLEFQVAKDRLQSAEKTTRTLQEKICQLQDRLGRQDKRAEKAEWELSSTRAEMFNVRQECEQRILDIRTDLTAEYEARIEFERNKALSFQERLEKLRVEVDRYAADNKALRDTVASQSTQHIIPPAAVAFEVGSPRRASVPHRTRHGSELWQVVRQRRGEVLENAQRERRRKYNARNFDSEPVDFGLTPLSPKRFASGFGSLESPQAQVQDLTLKLTLRDEHVRQLEVQLDTTRKEIEVLKKVGNWEGAEELRSENDRLIEEVKQTRREAHVASTAVESLRLELGKEKQETRKAEAQRAALAAERAKELKSRAVQAQELRDLKALLEASTARSDNLELTLNTAEYRRGSLCSQRAKAIMEDKLKELMTDRQRGLQEKVVVAREQVTSVLQENQVLRLALQEVTEENGRLTDTIKELKPEDHRPSPSIDEVLARMERVRDQGAGKYIRLYQDGHLRDVAVAKLKEVRDAEEANRQQRTVPQSKPVNVDAEANFPEPPEAPRPQQPTPPEVPRPQPTMAPMSARLHRRRPSNMVVQPRAHGSQGSQGSGSDVCAAIDGSVSPLLYMPKKVVGLMAKQSVPLPKMPSADAFQAGGSNSRSISRSPRQGSKSTPGDVVQSSIVISPKVEVRGSLLCGTGGMVLTNNNSTCLQSGNY